MALRRSFPLSAPQLLAALLTGLICLLVIGAAVGFLAGYPRTYTWSELLLSYQGGFVRRGLLGEIAFRLLPLPPVYSLSILIVAAYLYTTISIGLLTSRLSGWAMPLFLFAPTGLIYPVLIAQAYGRKDVFVILGFVLAIQLTASRLGTWTAFVLMTVIYTIVGLLQETAWFFYPLAVVLLLRRRVEADVTAQIRILLAAIAYFVACFALTFYFRGSEQQALDMVTAWKAVLSGSFSIPGPERFMSSSLAGTMSMVLRTMSNPTGLAGYGIGFALALVPLALHVAEVGFARYRSGSLLTAATAVSVLAMFGLYAIAVDWGRWTYLMVIHGFLFLIVIAPARDAHAPGRASKSPGRMLALVTLAAFIYGGTWQLAHWIKPGGNPLRLGWLLAPFA